MRVMRDSLPAGARKLLSGSAWLAVSAVLGQGSMLVAGILVANVLGVRDYGRFTLLQTTLLLFASLAQLSFSVVVAQQVARFRDSDPDSASRIATLSIILTLTTGSIMGLLLWAGREFLTSAVFRDPSLATAIVVIAAAIPVLAISAVQQGLFNGLERFREQAILSILLAPLVILAPFLAAQSYGLLGGLIGLAAALFARFVVAQLFLIWVFKQDGLHWWGRFSVAQGLKVVSHAAPATLAGLSVSLAIWGGQTMLARQPSSEIALGLFNAAYMVRTLVIFVPQQLVLALLPMLARGARDGSTAGPSRLLASSAKAVFAFSCAAALIVAALGEQILGLFGERFIQGHGLLLLLLMSAPLESLTITLYQSLQAQGRFWRGLLLVNIPLAICVLSTASLMIPAHLSFGLAAAWLIGWVFALMLTLTATRPVKEVR